MGKNGKHHDLTIVTIYVTLLLGCNKFVIIRNKDYITGYTPYLEELINE